MGSKDKEKEIKDSIRFFNHFVEFISDCTDMTDSEIDKELHSEGIDIDILIRESQHIVNDALEKDRLAWQKEASEQRKLNLKKFAVKTVDLTKLGKKELIARINGFADALEPDFSFAHRNLKLEDMSEDELRDILSEYEQLADE